MSQNTKYLIGAIILVVAAWYVHKHYNFVKKAAK
jgi:hypothetical protein